MTQARLQRSEPRFCLALTDDELDDLADAYANRILNLEEDWRHLKEDTDDDEILRRAKFWYAHRMRMARSIARKINSLCGVKTR